MHHEPPADRTGAAAAPPPAVASQAGRRAQQTTLAVAAAVVALAAAGAWAWRVDALVASTAPSIAPPELPGWAAGWFYAPGLGFMALSSDDHYGEPVLGRDAAGRAVFAAQAVYPAWRPPADASSASPSGRDDTSRPNDADVGHAYDIEVLAPGTVTVTVRGGDGAVVGSHVYVEGAKLLSPLLLRRDGGPVEIRAVTDASEGVDRPDAAVDVVARQTLRSVADGTAIQARTVEAQADHGGVRMAVSRLAAWPDGIALELRGTTARPRDRVFVSAAPFEAQGEPADALPAPGVRLRDDRGRTYPLVSAEAFRAVDRLLRWLDWDDDRLPFDPAPPEAPIGLPATLRFGPIAADAASLVLEVDDAFVVGSEQPVTGFFGDLPWARLTRAWGDVVTMPLPPRTDQAAWRERDPGAMRNVKAGVPHVLPASVPIAPGGARAVVESITTDGDVLTLAVRPTEGGFGRLLDVMVREVRSDGARRYERCDSASSYGGTYAKAGGRVVIPSPTFTVQTSLDDPTVERTRICFEHPLVFVDGRWTLPLPAATVLADQRANGTGVAATP